ncbi:kinesin motor catalytic domain protein (macronuclear) [Tetrahymena thermophila SB210]|uniref:Kinesin motor catalytic domain protein n=1 Tax=Tetrahymena thermophila (strain SB210) TaxID=312017 RepID=Q234E3_TETTS|nr:kinesin motor catalytic domain protein [Tetrahymena thermophila SB210]EAR92060.2 kinesin motor catalytic domain protein [Tetrahymena thermophila SB210]|eukprot:XP_001012305.2 kinesin motor catalytic domain protein [Tetrahymena thermophila SB210]
MEINKKSEESSITVVVRFKKEKNISHESDWNIEEDIGQVSITLQTKGLKNFKFDGVTVDMDQKQIYDNFAKPSILKFLQGFNGTIFTYGQTSSGKTYTMLGPEAVTEAIIKNVNNIPADVKLLFGIMPRSIFTIFDGINQGIKEGSQFILKCSYIEIYNENIHDLLSKDPQGNLKLREHKFQGWVIEGLEEKYIKEPEEILYWLSYGTKNRSVTATKMNERSSRSHTVFTLSLEQKLFDGTSRNSKMNLVDLAGSERLDQAQTTGQAKEETKNINRSLYYLQYCIINLSEKKKGTDDKDKYVNFRNSKLTRILKDALGGNSKTTLICAASMNKIHEQDTLNTLYFAQRAKLIKNKLSNNVKRSVEELETLLQGSQRSLMRAKRLVKDLLDAAKQTDFMSTIEKISGVQEFLQGNSNNIVVETEIEKEDEQNELSEPTEDLNQKYESLVVKFQEMEKHYKEVIRQTVEEVEELNKVRQQELESLEAQILSNEQSQKEIENLNEIIIQLQQKNELVYEELRKEKETRETRQQQEIQQLTERNNLCELLTKKVEEYKLSFTLKLDEIQKKDDENRDLTEKLNEAISENQQIQEIYKNLDQINEQNVQELAQLKLEVEQLRCESQTKDESIQFKIKQIIELQSQVEDSQNQNEDLIIKQKQLEEQITGLQNKNTELFNLIQQLQAGEISGIQKNLSQIDQTSLQDVYSPHARSKIIRESLQAIDEDWENVEQCREEMNLTKLKTRQIYIQKIKNIEDEFQNKLRLEQQRRNKLREDIEELRKENQMLKEENSSLKSKLSSYEQKFKDNSMEISKLHKSQSNFQIFQSSSKFFQNTQPKLFQNINTVQGNPLDVKANELNSMFSAVFKKIKQEREEIAKNRSELDLKHQTIKNSIEIQKRQIQTDIENIQNNEQLFSKLQNHMNSYKSANEELESLKIKQRQRGEDTKRIISHHRSISRSIFSGSKNIIHSIVKIPKQFEMFSDHKKQYELKLLSKDSGQNLKSQSMIQGQFQINQNHINFQNDDDDDNDYDQNAPCTPINFTSFDTQIDNLQCDEEISLSGKNVLGQLKSIEYLDQQQSIDQIQKNQISQEDHCIDSPCDLNSQNHYTPNNDHNKVTIRDDDMLSHQLLYKNNESPEKQLICSLEGSQIALDDEETNNDK